MRNSHLSMLTIIEGPDGCGKSVLAEKFLYARLADGVLHHGPYLEDGPGIINRYLDPMRYPPHGFNHVIFDRSWLSEPIYGWVKRHGNDRVGIAGRRYCERLALSCGGVVLMPGAEFSVCEARYTIRKGGEYLSNSDELEEVYNLYAGLGIHTQLPTFIVDPNATPQSIFTDVAGARPHTNRGPGVGNWNPKKVILIVGEAAGNLDDADIPFIAPRNNTDNCSFWLAEKLEEWGVPESDLYWINAVGRDGKETDPSFLTFLDPKRVVALGTVAATWCRAAAQVERFKTVEHPQYWKRFHYHQDYPLKEALL